MPHRRVLDRPAPLPHFQIGVNSDKTTLVAACPHRDYKSCFANAMQTRYPLVDLYKPRHEELGPVQNARRLFPRCAIRDVRSSDAAPARQLHGDDGPGESFVSSALRGDTSTRIAVVPPHLASLRRSLQRASARAASAQLGLRCASPSRALDERLLFLIGLPTINANLGRREAARNSWMRHPVYGKSVAACFLLSAHGSAEQTAPLLSEHAEFGDLLLLDSPETPQLITKPTRYSNFTKGGRGMPTFKQYAFFQHAALSLPNVPFIGKIDDDTVANVGLFVPLLASLRCRKHVLIGAINWAGIVPTAHDTGVRADRCGFGWSLGAALSNFGTSFGTPPPDGARIAKGYFPACDGLGSVPPFPYGTGAGYVFSAATLRWISTSPEVIGWVRDAAGPTREELQWQKFEDTSTGYWLTYAPFTNDYLNIGRWVHDMACHTNGAHKARGGGLYRPPTNTTLLAHNLKHGGFHYAAELFVTGADGYKHDACLRDVNSLKRRARIMARAAKGRGGAKLGGRGAGAKGRGARGRPAQFDSVGAVRPLLRSRRAQRAARVQASSSEAAKSSHEPAAAVAKQRVAGENELPAQPFDLIVDPKLPVSPW